MSPALYWLTPVMTFSILVGLALDYDLFLFTRVKEYRHQGYTNRAAIIKGVDKTGGIITAAGLSFVIFNSLFITTGTPITMPSSFL